MQRSLDIEPCTRYVIRFGDCDPFGHLNNARYLDYLVSAREDHLREFYQLDLQEFMKEGVGWVIGQHELVYLKPARYYEPVWIRTSLIGYSNHFVQVEALMLDETKQQVKALLWTKYYCVSITNGRKAEHPPAFLSLVEKLRNPLVDPAAGQPARVAQLLKKTVAP